MLRLLSASLLDTLLEKLLKKMALAELLAAAEVTGWLLELVSAGPADRLLIPGLLEEKLLTERLFVVELLAVEDATARLSAELLIETVGLEDPPPQLINNIVARQREGLIAQ